MTDRTRDSSASDFIARAGGRALAIPCDVTDHARVLAAVEEPRAVLGPIDRLIANAGGGEPTFVETFDATHMQRVFALNVEGTANCIEAVLPTIGRKCRVVRFSRTGDKRGRASRDHSNGSIAQMRLTSLLVGRQNCTISNVVERKIEEKAK